MSNKLKLIINYLKNVNFEDNLDTLTVCDVLFFCADANRGIQLNNRAYSPLLDSVRENFEKKGYKCITIAHPFSHLVGENAYGSPLVMNRSFFIAGVKKKFLDYFPPKKLNNPLLNLYKNIFEKSQAKLIITIGCNDYLSLAARDKKIYHLEILHGIGYTSIPWGWEEKEKKFLPQGIISLDEISKKTFLPLESKKIDIYQIPHPFLSRFFSGEIPKEWDFNKQEKKYKKEILVSLQWAFAGDHGHNHHLENILSNGLFYEELEEVIRITRNDIFWRFRFHPVQYRNPKKYKNLFDFISKFIEKYPNCEWRESTFTPLPSILVQCSGHITMHSMSSYEAAYMGVNTLALSPTIRPGGHNENMFNDLVDKGYMIKQAPKTEQILHWVKEVKRSQPLLNNLNDEHWFERLLEILPLD